VAILVWLVAFEKKEISVKEPPQNPLHVYIAIAGISALLCFAFVLTSSIWLTIAIVMLGIMQLGPFFPIVEEFIAADPLLLGVRRFSLLIIVLIFGIVWFGRWLQ
jgi:fucose permease